ncbi:hypothetical protein Hanom_Chr01g00057111 [Helianthus anomalus]
MHLQIHFKYKMARYETFWIQMRKNKHLDESRKTSKTSGTKLAFYSLLFYIFCQNQIFNCFLC